MESIRNVLKRFETGQPILHPTSEDPVELTVDERLEQVRQSLGISSWSNTFDNFSKVKGTETSFAAFKELAGGETEWQLLLCYGGVGNGKTHLCEATTIELFKRGIWCPVTTMAKRMRTLKQGMDAEAKTSYDTLIDLWCRGQYMILDDVGMGGSGSEWEWRQVEEIVVARYHDNLFTILCTNRDIEELPERIVSRFKERPKARLVLNSAEDYRSKK